MKRFGIILAMAMALFLIFMQPFPANAMGPKFTGPHTITCDALPANVTGTYVYWRTPGATVWDDNKRSLAGLMDRTPFDLMGLNLPAGTYELCATAIDSVGSESGPSNTVPFSLSVPGSPTNLRKQ